jgi:hypothetical protein
VKGNSDRRYSGKMSGDRYLGNTKKTEVHDLDNEQTSCQIDEIINAGHDKPFTLLSTAQATAMTIAHTAWADRHDSAGEIFGSRPRRFVDGRSQPDNRCDDDLMMVIPMYWDVFISHASEDKILLGA